MTSQNADARLLLTAPALIRKDSDKVSIIAPAMDDI